MSAIVSIFSNCYSLSMFALMTSTGARNLDLSVFNCCLITFSLFFSAYCNFLLISLSKFILFLFDWNFIAVIVWDRANFWFYLSLSYFIIWFQTASRSECPRQDKAEFSGDYLSFLLSILTKYTINKYILIVIL